jgi:hypothetical protein
MAPYCAIIRDPTGKENNIAPEDAELIADTRKGKLFIRTQTDMWTFTTTTDKEDQIYYDTFATFHITRDDINEHLAHAQQA